MRCAAGRGVLLGRIRHDREHPGFLRPRGPYRGQTHLPRDQARRFLRRTSYGLEPRVPSRFSYERSRGIFGRGRIPHQPEEKRWEGQRLRLSATGTAAHRLKTEQKSAAQDRRRGGGFGPGIGGRTFVMSAAYLDETEAPPVVSPWGSSHLGLLLCRLAPKKRAVGRDAASGGDTASRSRLNGARQRFCRGGRDDEGGVDPDDGGGSPTRYATERIGPHSGPVTDSAAESPAERPSRCWMTVWTTTVPGIPPGGNRRRLEGKTRAMRYVSPGMA